MEDKTTEPIALHRPPEEQRVTRRRLLKMGATIAGSALITSPLLVCIQEGARINKGASTQPAPQLAQTLESTMDPVVFKEQIEKRFNIEIRTIKEVFEASRKPYPEDNFKDIPTEWDIERLKMLENYMELLPKHFYVPNIYGGPPLPLRIILGQYSTIGERSSVMGYTPYYPYSIELDYKRFKPEDPKLSLIDLTHELTHIHTPIISRRIEKYEQPGGITGEKVVEESPWADAVERIVGRNYEDFYPIFTERLKEKGYMFASGFNKGWVKNPSAPQKSTKEEDDFANHFGYGLGHGREKEFIAVLAQSYIQGRDYFLRMYGGYLGDTIAMGLYEFNKNEIFRGQEYDSAAIKSLLQ